MNVAYRMISALLAAALFAVQAFGQDRDPFADDYETSVLQAVVDLSRDDSELGRRPVLLIGEYSWYRCSPHEASALSSGQFSTCPVQIRDLVREYFASKHTEARLPRLEGVRLLTSSERNMWSPSTSLQRYGRRGYSTLSRPVFDSTRSLALVYVAYYCGALCASESFFILERRQNQWRKSCEIALRDS